jgi:hypothetical protein
MPPNALEGLGALVEHVYMPLMMCPENAERLVSGAADNVLDKLLQIKDCVEEVSVLDR